MGSTIARHPALIILLALFMISLLVWVSWTAVAYNGLVRKDQAVLTQWAQVENEYQRKIDLIPRLVNITSQYTEFERSVLENITRLRTQWQQNFSFDSRVNNSIVIDQQL